MKVYRVYRSFEEDGEYFVRLEKESDSDWQHVQLTISKELCDYLEEDDLVIDWDDEYSLDDVVEEMYVIKLTRGKQ